MSVVCIVAIPQEDDHVWDISSETVPHLTLLNLGDPAAFTPLVSDVADFLEHAASQFHRFGLSVDDRGMLGPKEADVLIFRKNDWNLRTLDDFRKNLLSNRHIREAYDATPQFEEWIPHLTLGWPDSPAHEDQKDWGLHWINFDRVALWVEDSAGPTFRLEDKFDTGFAMSAEERGADFLEHFGVRGMKWGVRKNADGSHGTKRQQAKLRKVRSEASTDADEAGMAFGKLKRGGIHTLSNKELQTVITRMNLEQQLGRVAPQSIGSKAAQFGGKFVADVLIGVGKSQAIKIVGDQATKLVAAAMAAKK